MQLAPRRTPDMEWDVAVPIRDALASARAGKPNDRSAADRAYAIVITELEKAQAVFSVYAMDGRKVEERRHPIGAAPSDTRALIKEALRQAYANKPADGGRYKTAQGRPLDPAYDDTIHLLRVALACFVTYAAGEQEGDLVD